MADLESDLRDHFKDVVLVTAGHLQSWDTCETSTSTCTPELNPCDKFGEALLECVDCLSVPQVKFKKSALSSVRGYNRGCLMGASPLSWMTSLPSLFFLFLSKVGPHLLPFGFVQ